MTDATMHSFPESLGLAGRTIVVAGAGGDGIGTAVCRLLGEAGAAVAAFDVDPDRLDAARTVLAAAGSPYSCTVVDVLDEPALDAAVGAVAQEMEPLGGLVHVVGGLGRDEWGAIVDTPRSVFDAVLNRNLHAAFLTSRAVARVLLEGARGGSVVHIASTASQALPFGAAYSAAKAGVIALTRTSAIEWGPAGVRVNAVEPGSIATARSRAAGSGLGSEDSWVVPLGRRGEPADVAGAVAFLLSDWAAYVTGQVLAVDGGVSARPAYLDASGLPVFIGEGDLRQRLTSPDGGQGRGPV